MKNKLGNFLLDRCIHAIISLYCLRNAIREWWHPTLKEPQVKELLLRHLSEKYGEKFVVLSADVSHSFPLEIPNIWTFGMCPSGGSEQLSSSVSERLSSFVAQWGSPSLDSLWDIWDNYLLVKMRPAFREAIDQGLASVIPEFLAEYTMFAWFQKVRVLPGRISDEKFLQWAPDHITLNLDVVMPAAEGFTAEDLTAQIAPLVDSGNTFGALVVSARFDVYHQDDYSRWVSSREDLVQRRTDPGIVSECSHYNYHNNNFSLGDRQCYQKITWSRK